MIVGRPYLQEISSQKLAILRKSPIFCSFAVVLKELHPFDYHNTSGKLIREVKAATSGEGNELRA
jgi:hypothetical protein